MYVWYAVSWTGKGVVHVIIGAVIGVMVGTVTLSSEYGWDWSDEHGSACTAMVCDTGLASADTQV